MNLTRRLQRAVPLWQIHSAAALILLAVAGAAWGLGLRPIAAHEEHLAASRQQLQAMRQRAADLNASAVRAAKRLANYEEAIAADATPLEPASRINRRIALLTDLAQKTGLRIDELQPGATTVYQHHRTRNIRLVGGGAYPDCAAFIHQLRLACPDIGVRSLDLSSEAAGPTAAKAVLRMELTWFTSAE